jgi:UDP-N-acetylmuramoyl-L-alanyl-D-glutamate--2,6-diaminopimelate ligase
VVLRELIEDIPGVRLRDGAQAGTAITGVAQRADRVMPGDLFCAVPGLSVDGRDFVPEAVARGAAAVMVQREVPGVEVPQVLVDDVRLGLALAAAAAHGHPSRELTVVGITGTNGKTTCAVLASAMLQAAGMPAGLVGTIETRVGGRVAPAVHTTPDPVELQGLFRAMRDAGDRACAMEVSSHALHQRRVAGVAFDAALFTNLTRDHLDYHRTVDEYFAAKRMLFLRPEGEGESPPGAVNADDPYGRRLAGEAGCLTYAVEEAAEVRPLTVAGLDSGIRAVVATPRGRLEIDSALRGRFNLSNLLGVVAVGELLGLDHDAVSRGLGAVAGVPGRFEAVEAGQEFPLLVDYAHTPDSLHNVLVAARELVAGGRLIVVIGCGGDRDRGKRPQMGTIAGREADVAVITSDNPRSEDPDAIIAEILGGMGGCPAVVHAEPDRRAAIAHAVTLARAGDVVVVAGKGHEQGQERDGVVTPFDDRVVARQIVEGRARSSTGPVRDSA